MVEIPGFYYDKNKNRYFRITPGFQVPAEETIEKPTPSSSGNVTKMLLQRPFLKSCSSDQLEMAKMKSRIEDKACEVKKVQTRFQTTALLPSADFSRVLCFSSPVHGSDTIHTVYGNQKKGFKMRKALTPGNEIMQILNYDLIKKPQGVIYTYVPKVIGGHNSAIVLSLESQGTVLAKKVKDVPYSCSTFTNGQSNFEKVCYSSNRHMILTQDVERHFASNGLSGAYKLKLCQQIRSQNFSDILLFNGLTNGTIKAVDHRCQKEQMSIGCDVGHVRQIQSTSDSVYLVTRLDQKPGGVIQVWDIRFTKKTMWSHVACNKSRGNHFYSPFYVCNDRFLSCLLEDGTFNIWSLYNGQLRLSTDYMQSDIQWNCGMYTDSCSMFQSMPGVFGCVSNCLQFMQL